MQENNNLINNNTRITPIGIKGKKEKNKFGEIEEQRKIDFENKNDNPLDSIKKIKYVKELVTKTLRDIENYEKNQNQKVPGEYFIIEENKGGENETKKKNINNFAKRFIYKTKKVDELIMINELLIILKETNDLNKGINKLNSIIAQLNEKGHKLKKFEKNNMEIFLPITDMDKASYKKNSSGKKMISITINYS